MTPIRSAVIDDEPLARERIIRMLQSEPQIELVGEFEDGLAAAEAVPRLGPDLIFLDVQMPGLDGLQFLGTLPEKRRPAVIFVTAHPHFALDAYDFGAVDYLLKPFDQDRFRVALRRADEYLSLRAGTERSEPADRLAIKTDGKIVFVRPSEIHWVEAADNYVIVHLADRKLMARETLKGIEAQLNGNQFVRINRSAFVHTDQILELRPSAHGDQVVVLRDGTPLPLSRSLRGQWSHKNVR